MEHSYEYMKIYPDQIRKDPKYQREIDVARIKKITKNWDDDLVNPPKVSLRADGKYYVFNGQHTLAAWKKRYGNRMILCKVYRGLTETDEKDLFVKQEGFSKAVGNADKIRAEFNSGTADVVDMVRCAEIAGCVIDLNAGPSTAKNRVNAVVAAYGIYKTVGRDAFINVMDVLRRAFYGNPAAFQDGYLKGMAYLFKHYSDKFTMKMMIESISRQPAEWYKQTANSHTGSQQVRYAKAFAEEYNKKRKTNRIIINA